jgi:plasmid stabilization system protein ParE
MAYKIIWSPLATETFEQIIDYLNHRWTSKEIKHIISRTEEIISILKINPHAFRKSLKANLHEVLITKHNLLIYQIDNKNNRVELVVFFDTRQHPKKKKLK